MYLVSSLSQDYKQEVTLNLYDGSSLRLNIEYKPMQYGWFITELSWNDFKLTNIRIVNSPNLLHQWKNKISFGLACFSVNKREPMLLEDFSSSSSKLYILDKNETKLYAGVLSGQV